MACLPAARSWRLWHSPCSPAPRTARRDRGAWADAQSGKTGPFTVEGPVVARSHASLMLFRMIRLVFVSDHVELKTSRLFAARGGLQPGWSRYFSLRTFEAETGAQPEPCLDQLPTGNCNRGHADP